MTALPLPQQYFIGNPWLVSKKSCPKEGCQNGDPPPKRAKFQRILNQNGDSVQNLTGGSRNILEHDFVELTEESLRKIWRP